MILSVLGRKSVLKQLATRPTLNLHCPDEPLRILFFQREFNTGYLSSPDIWELPEVAQIAFPRPRNALRRRTADLVHSLYARIYDAIIDNKSGYTTPLPEDIKTPQQVASLLLPSTPSTTS